MCQSKQKIELISEKELRNINNISRLSFILWGIEKDSSIIKTRHTYQKPRFLQSLKGAILCEKAFQG